jgi:hypothetical protein
MIGMIGITMPIPIISRTSVKKRMVKALRSIK